MLLVEERNNREEKFEFFSRFISQLNQQLKDVRRKRNKEAIKGSIKKELGRLKITRFFEKPVLSRVNVTRTLPNGSTKRIISYQVAIRRKERKIDQASLLEGVCCFVTNHTEKKDNQFLFPAEKIIYGYRNKRKIEDAFKHLKSFLKIRPFWVNLDEHVKAVYTICVLSYFLDLHLARMRSKHESIEFLNSKNLYAPFKDCRLIRLKDEKSGLVREKVISPETDNLKVIEQLGLEHLLAKKRFQKTTQRN